MEEEEEEEEEDDDDDDDDDDDEIDLTTQQISISNDFADGGYRYRLLCYA
jgi:hypothetical protein